MADTPQIFVMLHRHPPPSLRLKEEPNRTSLLQNWSSGHPNQAKNDHIPLVPEGQRSEIFENFHDRTIYPPHLLSTKCFGPHFSSPRMLRLVVVLLLAMVVARTLSTDSYRCDPLASVSGDCMAAVIDCNGKIHTRIEAVFFDTTSLL